MSQRRQVFLENWQPQLEAAIADVEARTSVGGESLERDALIAELRQLRELVHQVRDRTAAERDDVRSFVIWVSVRESVQFPEELILRLGEIFDIYRRFKSRLEWSA